MKLKKILSMITIAGTSLAALTLINNNVKAVGGAKDQTKTDIVFKKSESIIKVIKTSNTRDKFNQLTLSYQNDQNQNKELQTTLSADDVNSVKMLRYLLVFKTFNNYITPIDNYHFYLNGVEFTDQTLCNLSPLKAGDIITINPISQLEAMEKANFRQNLNNKLLKISEVKLPKIEKLLKENHPVIANRRLTDLKLKLQWIVTIMSDEQTIQHNQNYQTINTKIKELTTQINEQKIINNFSTEIDQIKPEQENAQEKLDQLQGRLTNAQNMYPKLEQHQGFKKLITKINQLKTKIGQLKTRIKNAKNPLASSIIGRRITRSRKAEKPASAKKSAPPAKKPAVRPKLDKTQIEARAEQLLRAIQTKALSEADKAKLVTENRKLLNYVQTRVESRCALMEAHENKYGFYSMYQSFSKDTVIEFFKLFQQFNQGTQKIVTPRLTGKQTQFVEIGDLHGNLPATKIAIQYAKDHPEAHLVFHGDIFDRGRNSLECAMYIYSYQMLHPEQITVIAGDHEFSNGIGYKVLEDPKNPDSKIKSEILAGTRDNYGVLGTDTKDVSEYGLKFPGADEEETIKNEKEIMSAIANANATLPIGGIECDHEGHPLNLVAHGGLPRNIQLIKNVQDYQITDLSLTLADFQKLAHKQNLSDSNEIARQAYTKYCQDILGKKEQISVPDLLNLIWGDVYTTDPEHPEIQLDDDDYAISTRDGKAGGILQFSKKALIKACQALGVKNFIRGHQHGGLANINLNGATVSLKADQYQVITTFGAPAIGRNDNRSSLLIFDCRTNQFIDLEYEAYNTTTNTRPIYYQDANGKLAIDGNGFNHIRPVPLTEDLPNGFSHTTIPELVEIANIIKKVQTMELLKGDNISVSLQLLNQANAMLQEVAKLNHEQADQVAQMDGLQNKIDEQKARVNQAKAIPGPRQEAPEAQGLSVDEQVMAAIKEMQKNPDKDRLSEDEMKFVEDIQSKACAYEQEMEDENNTEGFEFQHKGADSVFKEDEVIKLFNLFERFNQGTPKIYDQKLTGDQTKYFTIGDLHGNLWATKLAIQQAEAQHAHLVILGDFLERGKNSIEVAMYLFAYKMLHPDRITIIAGDHDVDSMHGGVLGEYGFHDELNDRGYQKSRVINSNNDTINLVEEAINKATETLPWGIFAESLDHQKRSYLGHGGITENLELLKNIYNWGISRLFSLDKKQLPEFASWDEQPWDGDPETNSGLYNLKPINNFKTTGDDNLDQRIAAKYATDILGLRPEITKEIKKSFSVDCDGGDIDNLLWSDPDNEIEDYAYNRRDKNNTGRYNYFGSKAFAKFCKMFNITDFIRAHEHKENNPGARISMIITDENGNLHRVITTLGAPNIHGLGNNSAILSLDGMTLEPSIFKEYEAYNKETGESATHGGELNYNHIREFHLNSESTEQEQKKKSNLESVFEE